MCPWSGKKSVRELHITVCSSWSGCEELERIPSLRAATTGVHLLLYLPLLCTTALGCETSICSQCAPKIGFKKSKGPKPTNNPSGHGCARRWESGHVSPLRHPFPRGDELRDWETTVRRCLKALQPPSLGSRIFLCVPAFSSLRCKRVKGDSIRRANGSQLAVQGATFLPDL